MHKPLHVEELEARIEELEARNADLKEALHNLAADWERVVGRPIPEDHEVRAVLRGEVL